MGRGDPVSAVPTSMRNPARYGKVAMLLHWCIALLVIGMLVLGYYMVGIPKGTPDRAVYFNLHKSFGVLAGVLIIVRLLWRVTHRPPALPASMAAWNIKAAQGGHLLLYVLMLLQPLTGYLSSSFNKYGVRFFGLQFAALGGRKCRLARQPDAVSQVVGAGLCRADCGPCAGGDQAYLV